MENLLRQMQGGGGGGRMGTRPGPNGETIIADKWVPSNVLLRIAVLTVQQRRDGPHFLSGVVEGKFNSTCRSIEQDIS